MLEAILFRRRRCPRRRVLKLLRIYAKNRHVPAGQFDVIKRTSVETGVVRRGAVQLVFYGPLPGIS